MGPRLGLGAGVAQAQTDELHEAGAGTPVAGGIDEGFARDEARRCGLELLREEEGLCLTDGAMTLRPDLRELLPRLRRGRLSRELLVRAAKTKGADAPSAIDATAGLGEDSLLLAAAGFSVTLFESDVVIAALLADALRRAAADSELAPVVGRMRLICGDSVAALPGIQPAPDVVYLDPMFPGRTKSAAVKKKFQLLHHLERPCADERALLDAALAAHSRKVVIKRPVKGPNLAGAKPSYVVAGKAVRYDVLVPPRS